MPAATSFNQLHIGAGFRGMIKSMYIWNYAKGLSVMNMSPTLGAPSKSVGDIIDYKRGCAAYDDPADSLFKGYCPICDKYNNTNKDVCYNTNPVRYFDDLG